MNPFLARLGFQPDDRVIILHADDLGMCHAVNAAFMDIAAVAPVASGSVMIPCPWVSELAAFAKAQPKVDIGVHITLTSEWRGYRWRPLSAHTSRGTLLDAQGYLWADVDSLHAHMDPAEAIAEMRAQVEYALNLGFDITHIDTHMGAVAHPGLVQAYVELGLTYGIPVMIPRPTEENIRRYDISPQTMSAIKKLLDQFGQDSPMPIIDRVTDLYDAPGATRREQYQNLIESLPPGLTHLLYHPACPFPEIKAITATDRWTSRVADWEVFTDPAFWDWLARSGVHLIGYRDLREALPQRT